MGQFLLMVTDTILGFGYIDFTETGQDGVQQPLFVFDNDEESRRMTKEFNAATQGRLRIYGQTVGIQQYDRFEWHSIIGLYVGLGEKLELVADEFNALVSVRTIDHHDVGGEYCIGIHRRMPVYLVQKFAQKCAFS
jgi:hypothetical protein